jgi:hypothetical protein
VSARPESNHEGTKEVLPWRPLPANRLPHGSRLFSPAAAAEHHAEKGEIVCAPEIPPLLGDAARWGESRDGFQPLLSLELAAVAAPAVADVPDLPLETLRPMGIKPRPSGSLAQPAGLARRAPRGPATRCKPLGGSLATGPSGPSIL